MKIELHSGKTSAPPTPKTWQNTTNGRLDLREGSMKRNKNLSQKAAKHTQALLHVGKRAKCNVNLQKARTH